MKIITALLILSVFVNIVLMGFIYNSKDAKDTNEVTIKNYPFLSQRIFVEAPNDLIINFTPLRQSLQSYVDNIPIRTGAYFEYLPTGTSIGINDKDGFFPASLLKLPLAMGAYKNYESKKISRLQPLKLTEDVKNSQFGDLWKQPNGTQYTIDEITRILLIFSDNTAVNMILTVLSAKEIEDVFDALDIPKTRDTSLRPIVTPKNYSSILRCLYLSCYLTKEHSNEILTILTKSVFRDKLIAGIPSSIPVAHKIGTSENATKVNENVYTDCGIVYYPKRPYILCVMLEGNENQAQGIMKTISKITYDFVDTLE